MKTKISQGLPKGMAVIKRTDNNKFWGGGGEMPLTIASGKGGSCGKGSGSLSQAKHIVVIWPGISTLGCVCIQEN